MLQLEQSSCRGNFLLMAVLNLCSMLYVLFCQIEIRCTKVGEWTAEFSMCSKLLGLCSPPPNLNSVEYNCDQGRDVGEWNPEGQARDFLNTQC